jgi:hypothetical protein
MQMIKVDYEDSTSPKPIGIPAKLPILGVFWPLANSGFLQGSYNVMGLELSGR